MNENDNTVRYTYQDLDVKPNNTFGDNVAIPLINKNVRKVNIHVEKVDPNDPYSSNADCATILTWYKWDGERGLTTVKVEETH